MYNAAMKIPTPELSSVETLDQAQDWLMENART
jgi:hypothetical protein